MKLYLANLIKLLRHGVVVSIRRFQRSESGLLSSVETRVQFPVSEFLLLLPMILL